VNFIKKAKQRKAGIQKIRKAISYVKSTSKHICISGFFPGKTTSKLNL